jgi:hypothetical protein
VDVRVSVPPPARAARRLRTALLVLLLADAVAAWVVIVGVYTLLQRIWLGLADRVLPIPIETHVAQLEAARRLQGALTIATAVVFLLWVGRAHRNLRLLGVERLRFSPRAAVAAFLVPVVNVVVPLRVVSELWRASRPADPGSRPWWEAPTPALVTVWWILVVTAAIADPVWRRLAGDVHSLAIGGSTALFIAAQLGSVAAAVLGIAVVWTVDAEQGRQFAALERP